MQFNHLMAIAKLLHIFFVFFWVGSLLVLTRLAGYKEKIEVRDAILRITRRMYLYVELPSMLSAVGLGIAVLVMNKGSNFRFGYFHMKLLFAALLVATDVLFGIALFKNYSSTTRFKIMHGAAGLFLAGVLLAIYVVKVRNGA